MNGSGVFHHPALFYRGDDAYLAGTSPFVREGLAAGDPVAVAAPESRLSLLRDHLGAAAHHVKFVDMTVVGRNPGWIIPGILRSFADAHPGRRVRIIGEPIWAGRSETEYPACVQHEALINLAFAGHSASILCPYDAEHLSSDVLEDAAATHPVLIDHKGERASAAFAPESILQTWNRPHPEPASAAVLTFDDGGLAQARCFALHHGARLGLAGDRLADLELAVNELAANSIVHGGDSGTLRIWADDEHLVCEVSDAGHLADPLAGRRPAGLGIDGGRGLLLVNHIADLIRTHTTPRGTSIRLYLALNP
ncbi:anti-sigma factor RsbA family regulatory protein [Actinomadura sp. HBU206391]|uniref:anti-sigma factor RsbA family regulatory protein n=1 Tax=Actinomadura sp. HBU206391 TaxID=2731692 RepID=UPI001650824E|nr:anti-sigma factor RsbA family regulatory protein [Actinomadura sp. HBU206391]MBC6459895.1 MEDS domain-containing protein [Actinomadura sp. HBU206391]